MFIVNILQFYRKLFAMIEELPQVIRTTEVLSNVFLNHKWPEN